MLRINQVIETSKDVIKNGCLPNGAIVAANSASSDYPASAKHYFYVWIRDASFVCMAADILDMSGLQEDFFNWCLQRAEGFSQNGLFFEKYYVNGPRALGRFQPDQTGILLVALWHHYKDHTEKALEFEDLILKASKGICRKWDRDHFCIMTNDLWEERLTFPDLKDNFTYSLASCIGGLECAYKIIKEDFCLSTAQEMRDRLEMHFVNNSFARSYGNLIDENIDASMLGLIYPFGIYQINDHRIISTVQEIENKLVIDGGVHRYELDQYDGWMYEEMPRNKGGGAWPLLNFWLAIYYSLKGEKNIARNYYLWVLRHLRNREGYIPEQIFNNEHQISVSPLLWSHAMFIIASRHLGYI